MSALRIVALADELVDSDWQHHLALLVALYAGSFAALVTQCFCGCLLPSRFRRALILAGAFLLVVAFTVSAHLASVLRRRAAAALHLPSSVK